MTADPEPLLLTIGDIGISRTWITTPNGAAPLRGSTWIATDMSVTASRIPTWAIVLAVVFAFLCLLGLLFLLVKEDETRGYVQVSIYADGLQHATQVPVSHPGQVAQIRGAVAQAQAMSRA